MQTLDEYIAYHENLISILKQAKQDKEGLISAQAQLSAELTTAQAKLNNFKQTLLQIDNMIDEDNL